MKQVSLFLVFVIILAYGCQSKGVNTNLMEIDSLIVAELYDSAFHLVETMDESDFHTPEDLAHFNLLRVQMAYIINMPIEASDSILDEILTYYSRHQDEEKKAEAFYYMAIGAYRNKEYQRSIMLYKKAEQSAIITGNLRQQYKIFEGISFVNGTSANYDIQLYYAKKALGLAKRINNKNWIAYSFYRIALAYSNLGHEDSVICFLNQIPPYIDYIDKQKLPYLLSNIGYSLKETSPNKAKEYLLESLSYKEMTATYEHLADIAYDEGRSEEAYCYWKKALTVHDATPKDIAIHNIIEYDIERGKTDSICERINEIIAIRDSIDAKLKNDTIKDLQTRFDHEVEMREKDRAVIKWQWVAIALVILLLVGVIYYLVRKYQNRIQLQKYQMQIHDYMEQIRALSGKKDQTAEIDRLNKEIKKIMDEKSPRLAQGRILYDKVVANENMGKWRLDDVEKFIEYYTATNYRVVNRLQSIPRRDELTPHRLLYLILVEMKKTDQQICFIQGITKECLRVYRFRTQPIEKEETSEESDESL